MHGLSLLGLCASARMIRGARFLNGEETSWQPEDTPTKNEMT